MFLTTRLYTFLYGTLVGQDPFGNRYYQSRGNAKRVTDARKRKRWVIYKGMAEPSKVPAEWHGWLHYTHDLSPTERKVPHYDWQKPHQPNLTGTKKAYLPSGHLLKGAHRDKTTADYEAWQP